MKIIRRHAINTTLNINTVIKTVRAVQRIRDYLHVISEFYSQFLSVVKYEGLDYKTKFLSSKCYLFLEQLHLKQYSNIIFEVKFFDGVLYNFAKYIKIARERRIKYFRLMRYIAIFPRILRKKFFFPHMRNDYLNYAI